MQGRFADQVMYSLTDGRVMYVRPLVRDKLVELGMRQNEPFNICRAERREGDRRFVDWVVQPSESALPAPSANARRDAPESPTNGDGCAGTKSDRNGDGNGKPAAAVNAASTGESASRAALMSSIDVALVAEQYASAHGLSVRFGSADLRAMALSVFIQHARDGGVR